jgi:putative transposase
MSQNLARHGVAVRQAVLVIQAPDQVSSHWYRITEILRKRFPATVPGMQAAPDDVLAFLHFPRDHGRRVWTTNPLERLNKEIERRTNFVGMFPNDTGIEGLLGSQQLEWQEGWPLERRCFFSDATMAVITEPEEPLELTDGGLPESPSVRPCSC